MKGQRFLDLVAKIEAAYPNDSDFPSVLATSKYPPTMNTLESVLEFHQAFDCPVAAEPRLSPSPNAKLLLAVAAKLQMLRNLLREHSKNDPHCLRASLEIEELGEEFTAMANGELKGLLDAYVDKEYIDKGSILTFGLQDVYDEGFRRVHVSNMSKLVDGRPIKDEAGKVKKPPTYQPVVLDDLVDGTWLAEQEELAKF